MFEVRNAKIENSAVCYTGMLHVSQEIYSNVIQILRVWTQFSQRSIRGSSMRVHFVRISVCIHCTLH